MKLLPDRDRSNSSHAVLDRTSRLKKANKIITVLEEECSLENKRLLDIGTGSGYIASELAKKLGSKRITSVDVVDERRIKSGYEFHLIKNAILPFDDSMFDIVISNHVIEHLSDQRAHIDEVHRVLRRGGLVYLATPNKYWVTDPHFRLPFISWLPRIISSIYLKIIQQKVWDIHPLSLGNIHKLVDRRLEIKNITLSIIRDPERYKLDTFAILHPIFKKLPKPVIRLLSPLLPTLILILYKK